MYSNNMLEQSIQTQCFNHVFKQYVQRMYSNRVLQQYIETKCSNNVFKQSVPTVYTNNVFKCRTKTFALIPVQ